MLSSFFSVLLFEHKGDQLLPPLNRGEEVIFGCGTSIISNTKEGHPAGANRDPFCLALDYGRIDFQLYLSPNAE